MGKTEAQRGEMPDWSQVTHQVVPGLGLKPKFQGVTLASSSLVAQQVKDPVLSLLWLWLLLWHRSSPWPGNLACHGLCQQKLKKKKKKKITQYLVFGTRGLFFTTLVHFKDSEKSPCCPLESVAMLTLFDHKPHTQVESVNTPRHIYGKPPSLHLYG